MSTTPRLTDWTVPDAVLVAMRQERNALVAKVAAYEDVLAEVKDRLTLSIVEDETPPGYYLQSAILSMIDAALGDQR